MTESRLALTTQEAADLLGLSSRTLARFRDAGTGPAYCKVGRSVVYLESDLRSYLDERRVVPHGGGSHGRRR